MEMPTPVFENKQGCCDRPLVFRHIDLSYQLCVDMARSVAHLSGTVPPSKERKAQIARTRAKWFKDLPAEYALNDPNTRWDDEYKWVVSQRRFLHKFGYNLWKTFSFMEPSKTAVEPGFYTETPLTVSKEGLSILGEVWSETRKAETYNRFFDELLATDCLGMGESAGWE